MRAPRQVLWPCGTLIRPENPQPAVAIHPPVGVAGCRGTPFAGQGKRLRAIAAVDRRGNGAYPPLPPASAASLGVHAVHVVGAPEILGRKALAPWWDATQYGGACGAFSALAMAARNVPGTRGSIIDAHVQTACTAIVEVRPLVVAT
jgi:hypothetical protein